LSAIAFGIASPQDVALDDVRRYSCVAGSTA
jgi:hypothetical protein